MKKRLVIFLFFLIQVPGVLAQGLNLSNISFDPQVMAANSLDYTYATYAKTQVDAGLAALAAKDFDRASSSFHEALVKYQNSSYRVSKTTYYSLAMYYEAALFFAQKYGEVMDSSAYFVSLFPGADDQVVFHFRLAQAAVKLHKDDAANREFSLCSGNRRPVFLTKEEEKTFGNWVSRYGILCNIEK